MIFPPSSGIICTTLYPSAFKDLIFVSIFFLGLDKNNPNNPPINRTGSILFIVSPLRCDNNWKYRTDEIISNNRNGNKYGSVQIEKIDNFKVNLIVFPMEISNQIFQSIEMIVFA